MKVQDEARKERVRLVLVQLDPYQGEMGSCPYEYEAVEITEALEDANYVTEGLATIVTQVCLYRWGMRQWLDDGDKLLGKAIKQAFDGTKDPT
jgi:hypothetical protein